MKGLSAFLFCFLAAILWVDLSAAADSPARCVITIKSVQLQKDSGEWLTVIEPDRQVDLVSQEPVVSFFNDGHRVAPGRYRNFKITQLKTINLTDKNGIPFLYEAPTDEILISGKNDLEEFLEVKAKSFVSVLFELDLSFLPPKSIKQVTIAVDTQKAVISGKNIEMTI